MLRNSTLFFCLTGLLMLGLLSPAFCQTIMFDDFDYSGVDDPEFSTFNKWQVIDGQNGPPYGAQYSKDNIEFIQDPENANNSLVTLSTTVNGANQESTQARIETQGFEYFEGTYASRVYFTDTPNEYEDANIQTFYTIVSYLHAEDGSKYSELDFEYMASDKWGISPNNPVMYLTAWNRYIADPWQAWKRYSAYDESFEGWHTFIVSCTDGVNVNFWIDGSFMGSMATTDSDGTSVYPRSPMQVAFANWIWNHAVGNSTNDRKSTMKVDWVLFQKDTELTPTQVDDLVNGFRTEGIKRRNLEGESLKVTEPLSVNRESSSSEPSIYPNPANEQIWIQGIDEETKVTILDLTGKVVLEQQTQGKSIDVRGLPSGVYTITIQSKNRVSSTQFFKER